MRASVPGGNDAAHQEVLQHNYIQRALKRLERLDVPTTEFNRLVAQVIRDMRTHVGPTSAGLLDRARDAISGRGRHRVRA